MAGKPPAPKPRDSNRVTRLLFFAGAGQGLRETRSMHGVWVRILCSLALTGLLGGPGDAQPENDPHYRPVAAVGDREFAVGGPSGGIVRYFGTGSLEGSAEAVRAVITIPGLLRNSDVYEKTAESAVAALGEPAARTLVITPQFLTAIDVGRHHLGARTLRWDVESWLDGTPALAPAPLGAFEVLDAMVSRLADRSRFPALTSIIFAGHSAGGQLIQRYAVVGSAPDSVKNLDVRFVVANPSSYVYFDAVRPRPNGTGFALGNPAACANFNSWKYGFENPPPYVASSGMSVAAYESRYVKRRVSYLLGELDTDPNHPVLDRTCAAEAQGAYRLIRGLNYVMYLHNRHPTGEPVQDMNIIRGVGHDAQKMFTSPCGLAILFDRPRAVCREATSRSG